MSTEEKNSDQILYEWSYNPWIKDRFRTTGRFAFIIILGILSTYILDFQNTKFNNYMLLAVLLILALNIRSFLECRFTITDALIKPSFGRSVAFTDILGWRLGAKYFRIVVGRPNLRRELVSLELPNVTETLEKIMLEKKGPMLASNEEIVSLLKAK